MLSGAYKAQSPDPRWLKWRTSGGNVSDFAKKSLAPNPSRKTIIPRWAFCWWPLMDAEEIRSISLGCKCLGLDWASDCADTVHDWLDA